MLAMPLPGRRYDLLQLRKLRLPAQFLPGLVRRGYKARRIAWTARLLGGFYFLAGHLLAHLDHFTHGIAIAVAEVVEALFARRQREQVRLRQVHDVNIVADAGAIGRRIVRPENLALRRLAERDLEHVRDQVRLDSM